MKIKPRALCDVNLRGTCLQTSSSALAVSLRAALPLQKL